jgi:hypothetical protein
MTGNLAMQPDERLLNDILGFVIYPAQHLALCRCIRSFGHFYCSL